MSIEAIHRSNIDPAKWDELVMESDNASVCAEYWFINLLTDGNWWAYISVEKSGDWAAAIPVYISKKMGNKFSRQPLLSKYWGLIVRKSKIGDYQQQHYAKEHTIELLTKAIMVSVFDYFTCIEPLYPAQYLWQNVEMKPRFSYLLKLDKTIEEVRLNYSKTVRKKINKLKNEGFVNVLRQNSDDLEKMLVENLSQGKELVPARAIEPLKAISKKAVKINKGFYLSTLSPNGELAAAGFFLQNTKYVHFISGYVSPKYRSQNAMNLLVDGAINRSIGKSEIFDFFGSHIESIEAFFRSFGAYSAPYYRIVKAKFPFNLIWKA